MEREFDVAVIGLQLLELEPQRGSVLDPLSDWPAEQGLEQLGPGPRLVVRGSAIAQGVVASAGGLSVGWEAGTSASTAT